LIVIVNYRTPGQTIDCLASLARERVADADFEAVVVENASGDASAQKLQGWIDQQAAHSWARVLPVDRNLGFAGGNNAAIEPALQSSSPPELFLLLNPDTIVHPGALPALIDFLDQHPRAGIAGSRLENLDGTPQRSAFRFPGILSEFERAMRLGICSRLLSRWLVAPPVTEETKVTDWLAGASVLVRRQVFEQVGPLDSRYFLYYEELDFCLRAARQGWEIWYVPASRVCHLVGQATGIKDDRTTRRRMPAYWFASRRRYFEKNYGWIYARLADLSWLIGNVLWRMRRLLQRKPDDDPPGLLVDFCRYSLGPHRDKG
jgi:GT2 family glycosyltransferase